MKQCRKRRMRWGSALINAASLAGVVLLGQSSMAQNKKPTAREIVAAIQAHVGIPWMEKTVDTFKAGNPDTPVTGIAVTMMATMDVLQRAAANGQNLVITHEPTFYNHLDVPEGVERAIRSGRRSASSLRSMESSCGDFTTTGTGENRTEFWPGWYTPWAGRNMNRKKIRICSRCRRER